MGGWLHVPCYLLMLAGFVSIGLGGLGVSSHKLRRRLPVQSPISLLHAGGSLFGLGFFANLVVTALRHWLG